MLEQFQPAKTRRTLRTLNARGAQIVERLSGFMARFASIGLIILYNYREGGCIAERDTLPTHNVVNAV
jgi:hypothetical protein